MGARIGWWAGGCAVALAVGGMAMGVRRVADDELAVARGAGASRVLPPGWHWVNPLRERLHRVPAEGVVARGVASAPTADGFTIRLPFEGRLTLRPGEFEIASGDEAGLGLRESVERTVAAGLEGWVGTWTAAEILQGDPGAVAPAALAAPLGRVGLELEELVLGAPDPDIYLFLAEDGLVRGSPERHRSLIEAAAARSPDDPRLITAIGLLHEAAGDIDAAEAAYLRALQRQPGAETALGRMVELLTNRGEVLRLDALLLEGAAANPGSRTIHNWLGLHYLALERPAEALHHLERAREIAPNDPVTLTNLAGLYVTLGRLDEAADLYRRGLEESPGSQRLLFNLGLAELQRGNLEAAREALEAARRQGPGSARLFNLLAETYRRAGMKEEATAALEASFAVDPEQPGLRETLTRLRGHPPD